MLKASSVVLACALALAPSAAVRAEPAVIGLARAYLGPESTLEGIASIHYYGTLDRVDPDHAGGPIHSTLDLIFVKPLRQRLIVRQETTTITTVLDGYDAWDFLQDNSDPTKHRLKWLPAGDIKVLRANTWENLYFFRGREGGATVADKGPATIDGIACERVDFSHGPGIVYERYFDRDTGRLVLTVRGPETIRERGEIRVDGLRFSKAIVSVTKTASGKDLVSTVSFTKIVLNEPEGPEVFAVPSILPAKPNIVPAKVGAAASPPRK
jgi:hypothetical protein